MPVVTDFTALIAGNSWAGIEISNRPAIVTYSFSSAAPSYTGDIGGFTGATAATFEAFSAEAQAQARTALAEWAAACGIVFAEVPAGQGDITFQAVDLDTTSYAGAGGVGFYPFGDWNGFTAPYFRDDLDVSGDIFMNSRFEAGGEFAYGALLHEIGHALGLKHPTEVFGAHDEVLASDDSALTIMASGAGTAVLKQLDKDAVAHLYGAAGTGGAYTGNASGANGIVSSWSWNATTLTLTQNGFVGDDAIRGSSVKDVIKGLDGNDKLFGLAGNDILHGGEGGDLLEGGSGADSMRGGNGDDTYFAAGADVTVEAVDAGFDTVIAGQNHTLRINVEVLQLLGAGLTGRGNAGANSLFGDGAAATKLYGMDGNDYAVGGSGADRIYGGGNDDLLFGLAGTDRLSGDAGADILTGGGGNDVLTGGAGADRFDFSAAKSAGAIEKDRIADFEAGPGPGDVIAIDDSWLTPLGISNQAQLAAAFVVSGADLKLVLDAANSITLMGGAGMVLSSDDVQIT